MNDQFLTIHDFIIESALNEVERTVAVARAIAANKGAAPIEIRNRNLKS